MYVLDACIPAVVLYDGNRESVNLASENYDSAAPCFKIRVICSR